MGSFSRCIIFVIVITVTLFSSCAATGTERPKRILLDDNYYTIINELHNLSKAVETLTSENARLSQQVQDLKAVKGVAFKASLTTSITSGQKQVVIFNQVELNIGNAYNVLHGNFLAPINGTYLFVIYACSQVAHAIVLDLMLNGSSVNHVLAGDQNYHACNSNTLIIELKKGDDVYVSVGSGDYLKAEKSYGYPHFSGVLLSAS